MFPRTSVLVGTALAAMLTTASSAHANLIDWTVSGTFDDGGSFSGSFEYDTSAGSFTGWSIETTEGGTLGPFSYPTGFGSNTGSPDGGSGTVFSGFLNDDSFYSYYAVLDFTNLNPASPGSTNALAGFEVENACTSPTECFAYFGPRTITSGMATGTDISVSTPEPASIAVLAGGIAVLGAYRRRRHAT